MKRIVLHLPLMNLWSEQTAATESETSFSNHFFCKPPSGGPYCAKQFSENKPSLCWLHDSTQSNISEKRAAIFSPFHTHLWADQPTVAKRLISVPAGTERQYYSICQVCQRFSAVLLPIMHTDRNPTPPKLMYGSDRRRTNKIQFLFLVKMKGKIRLSGNKRPNRTSSHQKRNIGKHKSTQPEPQSNYVDEFSQTHAALG